MPVQEQTPYIKYVANGVTQTFSTEFDCESKDQLVVMLNGEEPAFTSWSYTDKQVTFVTAPVVDTVVELKRQSKLNRTTDYQSFNHTLNYRALNSDFDRIWYAIQEQNYKVNQYDFDYNFVLTQVRPISTGGTGANNVVNARSNLNVYSKAEVDSLVATGGEGIVLGIGSGGTGSTTEEGARANLDVYSQAEVDLKIDEATPNATTINKGVVVLVNDLTAGGTDKALTAEQGKKLNDQAFGVGQTWVDVASERVANTSYLNPSSRPIQVAIMSTSGGHFQVSTDGVNWVWAGYVGASGDAECVFPSVPAGHRYRLTSAFQNWSELK